MSSKNLLDGGARRLKARQAASVRREVYTASLQILPPYLEVKTRESYTSRGGTGGVFGKMLQRGACMCRLREQEIGREGQEKKLGPKAGEYVPGGGRNRATTGENELNVTM